jgi:hypothetical protein
MNYLPEVVNKKKKKEEEKKKRLPFEHKADIS